MGSLRFAFEFCEPSRNGHNTVGVVLEFGRFGEEIVEQEAAGAKKL